MAAHPVVQAAAETIDCALERGVLEPGDLPAAVADDVVMVVAAWDQRLVSGAAVPQFDAGDEPGPVQEIERPVDAGRAHPIAAGAQALGDLLGAEAAVLESQQPDNGPPRAAGAMPRLAEGGMSELGPTLVLCH